MKFATGDRPETGDDYTDKYEAGQHRKIVADTWEGMGIVVPAGLYKPLAGPDLAEELAVEEDPKEIARLEQAAMELLNEGFPGAALKLGKDLWISNAGRASSYALLEAAYDALERPLLKRMVGVARDYRIFCDTRR